MDQIKEETEAERLVRAWAECHADLEVELGLPMEKRATRITELIAERAAAMAAKPLDVEMDPVVAEHLDPTAAPPVGPSATSPVYDTVHQQSKD